MLSCFHHGLWATLIQRNTKVPNLENRPVLVIVHKRPVHLMWVLNKAIPQPLGQINTEYKHKFHRTEMHESFHDVGAENINPEGSGCTLIGKATQQPGMYIPEQFMNFLSPKKHFTVLTSGWGTGVAPSPNAVLKERNAC
jgi:hypothetical protein